MNNLLNKAAAPQSQLLDLLLGPVRWSLLETALELKLFDQLADRASAVAIADQNQFSSAKAQVFLDALTSLGVLTKNRGLYIVDDQFADLLSSSSQGSMRHSLLHLAKVKHSDKAAIVRALQGERSPHPSASFAQPEFWDRAVDNLRAFHASCSYRVVIKILQGLAQWHSMKSFMDLGAGSEYLAANLAGQRPELAIRIFDLAPCAQRIKTALTARQLAQIEVIAGDYNSDAIKPDNDLIWASMSLYYAQDLQQLLSKLHTALSHSGILVSLHEGLYAERTQPEHHVVGRFVPAINGIDVSFNRGEIAQAMRQVGFSRVVSESIDTDFGPMQLDIGYR